MILPDSVEQRFGKRIFFQEADNRDKGFFKADAAQQHGAAFADFFGERFILHVLQQRVFDVRGKRVLQQFPRFVEFIADAGNVRNRINFFPNRDKGFHG